MTMSPAEYMKGASELCVMFEDDDIMIDNIIFSMVSVAQQMGWSLDLSFDEDELEDIEDYLDTVPP